MQVEVVRSARRRKTVEARRIGDLLRISSPAHMSAAEERRWVAEMTRRAERQASARGVDLEVRAATLARRYGLAVPGTIRFVDNQRWRWGSCTPEDASVRISTRVATMPPWVLDYVVVHELAHLTHFGHDAEFWALVGRYPLTERARGYLMAVADVAADAEEPVPAPLASVPRRSPPRPRPGVDHPTLFPTLFGSGDSRQAV